MKYSMRHSLYSSSRMIQSIRSRIYPLCEMDYYKNLALYQEAGVKDYSIINNVTVIITVLITTEMELTALDSPTSPFRSPVKAGAAEAMGLMASIVSACLYSRRSGTRK